MADGASLVAFHDEARDREFADVIGCVLVSDMQPLGNIRDGQFRLTLQEIQYLDPPMIRESLHDPLDPFVIPFIGHTPIVHLR